MAEGAARRKSAVSQKRAREASSSSNRGRSLPTVDTAAPNGADESNAFFVHINGWPCSVSSETPFVNLREMCGQAGVLLQDVTVCGSPLLLLPCPHTGNVRVLPRRCYRLMKFIGEHLCLAGDFAPVADDDDVAVRLHMLEDGALRRQRREAWAMSELVGMMAFLRKNPHSKPRDFEALSPEEAARYHAVGSISLLGGQTDDDDGGKEVESEGEVHETGKNDNCGTGGSKGKRRRK
ncbi:hypothetical protein DQ04_03901010 [Trypanosoma grayi]|uniref:hypothetical protein n=1 Tax=Trypanosoma grayi TaxID=71804 RepID=UPI0004F49F0D|nr:hypothetical protein DQ04_03901010 [Trypanosoma grayi]KEG10306.1 hypothetical protein DQ04_03901010 [Trypanosoma grayi]